MIVFGLQKQKNCNYLYLQNKIGYNYKTYWLIYLLRFNLIVKKMVIRHLFVFSIILQNPLPLRQLQE